VLKALLGQKDAADALRKRGVGSVAEAEQEVKRVVTMLCDDPVMYGFFRRRVDHVEGLLSRTPEARLPEPAPAVAPFVAPTPAPRPSLGGPSDFDTTGPIDAQRLGLDTLPFDAGAQAAPLPPVADAPHPEAGATAFVHAADLGLPDSHEQAPPSLAPQGIDETGFLDPGTLGDLDEPLPFDEDAPVQLDLVSAAPHPEAGATAFVDASALGLGDLDEAASHALEGLLSDVRLHSLRHRR